MHERTKDIDGKVWFHSSMTAGNLRQNIAHITSENMPHLAPCPIQLSYIRKCT